MFLRNVTLFNIFTFLAAFNAEQETGGGLSFRQKKSIRFKFPSLDIFTFLASFNAENRCWAFWKQKSISGKNSKHPSNRIRLSHGQGLLKSLLCRNITVLASLNAEKRWWAFFEEKSISGANIGSACHTAKAY